MMLLLRVLSFGGCLLHTMNLNNHAIYVELLRSSFLCETCLFDDMHDAN